jgi:hypothetical protein
VLAKICEKFLWTPAKMYFVHVSNSTWGNSEKIEKHDKKRKPSDFQRNSEIKYKL